MTFYGLRLGYALEGSSNFIVWRDIIEVVLEDNCLKEFIDQEILESIASDVKNLAEWKKCVAKARRIILKGVQDHIVLSLHGKENPYAMWKTLTDLYQNNSDKRKLALKEKLQKNRNGERRDDSKILDQVYSVS